MDSPFDIKVYDGDLAFTGYVVDPIYAHFVPSWENQSYGNFMLDAGAPYTEELQAEGARITCEYRGKPIYSGIINSWRGDIDDAGTATYQTLGDERVLENGLLFPHPTNPLMPATLSAHAQAWNLDNPTWEAGTVTGLYSYYPWPANIVTAEQAIKHIIQEQLVDRLGMRINVLPNKNRGGNVVDVLPKLRMVPISEVLTPILKASPQLGIHFWQEPNGTTINMDVREPDVWEQPLSLENGTISSGAYSKRHPTATRVIVGGPGETAGRAFSGIQGRGFQTETERTHRDIIEVLREADNMTDLTWPTGLADKYKVPKYYPLRAEAKHVERFWREMNAAEKRGLTAGAPTTGLSLKLAESEGIRFGGEDGLQLGDIVTADIRGVEFTDRISEVMLTFTRDSGLVVEPVIGDREDDPDTRLAKSVTALYRALRRTTAAK